MKVAIIFYSLTGNVAALARAMGEGAERAGAEVRLRRVAELLPESAFGGNPRVQKVRQELSSIPLATDEDVVWADGLAFGSPTRFGNMSAQLKFFLDQLGPLWFSGRLVGKAASVFCSSSAMHGGQESTLLSMMLPLYHLGFIVVGLPYSEAEQMSMEEAHGGSPYGASSVSGATADRLPTEIDLTLARALGKRLAIVAGKLQGR